MPATLSSSNGQTQLGTHTLTIGRASDNQLVLNDPTVSGHHAEIRPQGQDYIIVDLGSKNGTFVNGQRLAHHVAHLLKSGDTIRIGATTFTYYNDNTQFSSPTVAASAPDETTGKALPATPSAYPSPPSPQPSSPAAQGYGSPAAPPQQLSPAPPPPEAWPATPPSPPQWQYPQQGYASPPPLQQPVSPNYGQPSPPPAQAAPGYWSAPPPSGNILPEQLQFTAFHPQIVDTGIWHTLLVYAHIESALELVRADAARFRAQMGPLPGETSAQATIPLLRGAEITIVPSCQGVEFVPERVSFKWTKDWHPIPFSFMADPGLAGSAGNGEIAVYAGIMLIATLKIAFLFEQRSSYLMSSSLPRRDNTTEVSARIYKQIFTSYSHGDTPVVLACRNAYKALGDQVFIDIDALRSGQNWNMTLMKLIEDADIFQLFWSPRSARSQYVRREWEYALQHYKGEGFIRPVYWKKPLVPPPPELSRLHFAYVQLPKLRISDYGRLFSWSISRIFKQYD